jgi:FPC/CPF motif-containing protein YcgG
VLFFTCRREANKKKFMSMIVPYQSPAHNTTTTSLHNIDNHHQSSTSTSTKHKRLRRPAVPSYTHSSRSQTAISGTTCTPMRITTQSSSNQAFFDIMLIINANAIFMDMRWSGKVCIFGGKKLVKVHTLLDHRVMEKAELHV